MNHKEPTLDSVSEISAQQVADYLKHHPEFFDQSPQLLSEINVPHPQSGQAISLVERQASVLRDRIKSMELKLAELLRHGQENDVISASIQRWVRGLLLHRDDKTAPHVLADSLGKIFNIPQVAITIWLPGTDYEEEGWVSSPAADYVAQIDGMRTPICGPATISAAVRLLPDTGRDTQSIAVLPLRVGAAPDAFGVLVLGSPDARRFAPDLGVAFLERIAEIASAALTRVSSAGA